MNPVQPQTPQTGAPIARVLSIAGTDPSGGAGIHADIKSISAAGGYAMAATTALVAQNTCGVRQVYVPPVSFLIEQLDAVFDDVAVDGVKIGMLGDCETIDAVRGYLQAHPVPVVVLDPVMVATSGDRLLSPDAEQALSEFAATVDVITPNIPELAVLTGNSPAATLDEAIEQAQAFANAHGTTVIVKGGHLDSADAGNVVVSRAKDPVIVHSPRVDTTCTHGTGCSLSSALATRLASGEDAEAALRWSTAWLREAIVGGSALKVGQGHGPVDHSARARRLAEAAECTPWPHLDYSLDLSTIDVDDERLGSSAGQSVPNSIAAAGPHTQRLWDLSKAVWEAIISDPFVTALGDGTLSEESFSFYLAQDALYLNQYSRALAMVASSARRPDDQAAWAQDAHNCLVAEAELHRQWLATRPTTQGPSHVTLGYTNFLVATAATCDYAVAAAATLPCYWLYAEVGTHLSSRNHPQHPYAAWLDMYSGDDFTQDVRMAIERVEYALEQASPEQRHEATSAYLTACIYEREFFDQSLRVFHRGV